MTTTIVLIMSLFNWIGTSSEAPDLCADSILDASGDPVSDSAGLTLSRYCEWAGPEAPHWGANVCCEIDAAGASCVAPNSRGTCDWGASTYCEHAEITATGAAVCYQSFPSTCDEGLCGAGTEIDGIPKVSRDVLCCENGDCWEWDYMTQYPEDCLGYFSWCSSGYLKEDGTVDCWD